MDKPSWCRYIFAKHFYYDEKGCLLAPSSSYTFGKESISCLVISLTLHGLAYPEGKPKVYRKCGNKKCYNPDHLTYDFLDRFFYFVDDIGDESSCWNWMGSKDGGGYGIFICKEYGREKAHRLMYMETYGEIPEGMYICHTCDNPSCVNPSHLFLGTNQDNIDDKVLKDRQSRLFGKNNGRSKLSEMDVINMRKDYKSGNYSYRDLVKKYNIGQTQVARIIKKESWSWL